MRKEKPIGTASLARAGLAAVVIAVQIFSAGNSTKERWQIFPTSKFPELEGEGGDGITAIALDSLGDTWFGTRGGLVRMTASETWETFTLENTEGGLAGDTINCLLVDDYSDLWIGTSQGLCVYSNGEWRQFRTSTTQGGPPDNDILSIARDSRNNKWIGTRSGFAKMEQNFWTTYSGNRISGLIPDHQIYAIAVSRENVVWLGTVSGLIRFNGSSYKIFSKGNTRGGLPNNFVTHIKIDASGAIWIGTRNGFACYKDKKWKTYTQATHKWVPGDEVYYVSLAMRGGVLFGMRGGAVKLQAGAHRTFTMSNTFAALPSRRILSVFENKNEVIWFGTRKGLCRLIPIKLGK